MTARVDPKQRSALERETRRRWLANAAHVHFGVCAGCHRSHGPDGKPLLVARQSRRRNFECIECWEFGS